jgi:hypothetical protein
MLEDSIALVIWLANKWKTGTPPGVRVAMKGEELKSLVPGRKVEGGSTKEEPSNTEPKDQQIYEPESQETEDGVGLVPPAIDPNVGSRKDDDEEEGGIEVVAV